MLDMPAPVPGQRDVSVLEHESSSPPCWRRSQAGGRGRRAARRYDGAPARAPRAGVGAARDRSPRRSTRASMPRRFPGRYIFHRDISHNVLPRLPAVDAALIDGDHNWFTVYHELRMLREAAAGAGAPAAADHARRLLALRPARPLLRARAGSRRSSASPTSGAGCGRGSCGSRGRPQPAPRQRARGGWPRNGVMTALDDFGRARPPVARGRAAALLRAGDRRRPGPARGRPGARSAVLDRLESGGGPLRAARARRVDPDRERVEHHESHFAVTRRAAAPLHRYLDLRQGRCSTSTTSRTRCASAPLDAIGTARPRPPKALARPRSLPDQRLRRLRQDARAGEPPRGLGKRRRRTTRSPTRTSAACGSTISSECSTRSAGEAWTATSSMRAPAAAARRSSCGGYLDGLRAGCVGLWVADRFGGGDGRRRGRAGSLRRPI